MILNSSLNKKELKASQKSVVLKISPSPGLRFEPALLVHRLASPPGPKIPNPNCNHQDHAPPSITSSRNHNRNLQSTSNEPTKNPFNPQAISHPSYNPHIHKLATQSQWPAQEIAHMTHISHQTQPLELRVQMLLQAIRERQRYKQ